jgi:hypothetical protein
MPHRNAPLTETGRLRLARCVVEDGWPARRAAERFQVSHTTAARWADHRKVINGVLWRTRTGSPWRDLPGCYGCWQTVYDRHRRWSADGTWAAVLAELRREPVSCSSRTVVSVLVSIRPRPAPFTGGHPDRACAVRGRWRPPVNAGVHCWKACWGQPLASSNLASSATLTC